MLKLLNLLYLWIWPRTTQQVLNMVIDEGYYTDDSSYVPYMCVSLAHAYMDSQLTLEEYRRARTEIRSYLTDVTTLAYYLRRKNLPHSFRDKRSIYQDWINRP